MPTPRTQTRRPTAKRSSKKSTLARQKKTDRQDRLVTQELRALYGEQLSTNGEVSRLVMPERGRWLRTVAWFGAVFMGAGVALALIYPVVAGVLLQPSKLLLRLGE